MKQMHMKLDLRVICIALALVIVGMLAVWQPWIAGEKTERKVTLSGEATVKAIPDEFVFQPYFERTGVAENALKQELNTYGDKLLTDLKNLGVAEKDVTLESDAYRSLQPEPVPTSNTGTTQQTVTLRTTIRVVNKDLAQKVQNYLAGTDAKGQLTAQPSFSEAKRKELENQARSKAITDAKNKAAQAAKNLDAKLGKVLEITDTAGEGTIRPLDNQGTTSSADKALPVTPGQQQVTVAVQVAFELR